MDTDTREEEFASRLFNIEATIQKLLTDNQLLTKQNAEQIKLIMSLQNQIAAEIDKENTTPNTTKNTNVCYLHSISNKQPIQNSISSPSQEPNELNSSYHERKIPKPPHIKVMGQSSQVSINIIKNQKNFQGSFSTNRIGENFHSIKTENITDLKSITALLKQNNVNFYSNTSKSENDQIYLLKKLEGNYNETEILEDHMNNNVENLEFKQSSKIQNKKIDKG